MNGDSVAYLDASAAVKLVRDEPETAALRESLTPTSRGVSSRLLQVELRCFAHRVAPERHDRVAELIDRLTLIPLTPPILTRAGEAFAPPQGAVDALHIATALALDLEGLVFVTYDERQLAGARDAGLEVARPGA